MPTAATLIRSARKSRRLTQKQLSERGSVRGVLGLAEPETTKHAPWDAAIAGLVAWRLAEESIPLPDWVNSPELFVSRPRGLAVDRADPVPPASEVPPHPR